MVLVFSAFIVKYTKDTQIDYYPQMDYSDSRDRYFSDYMALPEGDYGVTIFYNALEDTEVCMYLDLTNPGYPAVLSKDDNEFFYELHVDDYNDIIHFGYSVDDPEDFHIEKICIKTDKPIFSDYLVLDAIFLVTAILCLAWFMSDGFIKTPKTEKAWMVVVFLSVLISSVPLFSENLFWGHDAPAHVMRLEGMKDALLNGQIPVFIFPKNANGYGLLGYLYPNLFLYIPAVCRILGTSIPFIMNVFYVFTNVLTAIIAYIGAGAFYERREARYVFSVLYVLLPYRLVNIYTRADIGETMAMCFIPLILAGLYVCVSDSARWNGQQGIAALVIGITGVVHSHVLSSAMLVGVALLYAVIFIKIIFKKEKLKIVLWSVVGTLLLNIGYIVPFIKMYTFGLNFDVELDRGIVFEGKYSLLELLGIHDFSGNASWGGVSVIGVLGIILFLVGFLSSIRKKDINIFMVVSGLLSILLLVSNGGEFPWYVFKDIDAVSAVMRVFEFSFRVMLISAPLLTIVMTYYLYKMEIREKQRNAIVFLFIVTAFICVIPGLTGELKAEPYIGRLGGGASETILREYLPEGVTPGVYDEDRLFWSSENLIIDKYEKDGLKIGFDYAINGEGNEWIAPPVLYYPGYKAVAVTSSGEEYPLGVSQGAYYRTQIDLPASLSGSHVKMYFGGIWYFYIAYAVSTITALIFILFLVKTLLQSKAEKGEKNTNAYG
jgi:multisubunit Na+/H+ antiporter MnhG subunit